MATTYTAAQLYGNGVQGENITTSITFTFDNPSGSSYFTLESNIGANGVFTQACTAGAWEPSTPYMGPVSSSYMAAVVVQPGASSVKLTPTTSITGTNYRMRGTGAFSVTTS